MLDYASLAAVAQVVRDGSFERAARALHVTPSAISQRIRLLEERLGLALIVRGTPCTATEAGQRLCRHVEQVGMLEHDLHRALPAMGQAGDPAGRLTLKVAVNADSLDSWFVGPPPASATPRRRWSTSASTTRTTRRMAAQRRGDRRGDGQRQAHPGLAAASRSADALRGHRQPGLRQAVPEERRSTPHRSRRPPA